MQAIVDSHDGVEPARVDSRAQPLARRGRSRAIRRRPFRAGASSSTTSRSRRPAAELRAVLHARRCGAGSLSRYLVNGLREAFDLPGTPIRLTLREKANPYAARK